MRFLLCGLFLAVCAVASVSYAFEVIPIRTLGSENDDLFLHNPASVTFAPDGTIYLLNAGDCQVLHLDADWNLLHGFGRCGKGPGEFENPVGMVLHGGRLWVFEMARIVIYSLDGELVRTLLPGVQYAKPFVLDGRLLAVMGMGDRSLAYLDDDGLPISWLGPSCPEDFFEAFKECRNQILLPHDDGTGLLLNPISCRAMLIGEDGDIVWQRHLLKHEDDTRFTESEDGEQVSMSLSFGMGLGCRDPQGRYWVSLLPEEEGDPSRLRVLDGNLEPLGADVVVPEDVFGWELLFSPTGQLVLVSPMESVITLCEVSDDPAGE